MVQVKDEKNNSILESSLERGACITNRDWKPGLAAGIGEWTLQKYLG
jgi:hypothetical protein